MSASWGCVCVWVHAHVSTDLGGQESKKGFGGTFPILQMGETEAKVGALAEIKCQESAC